jgi:hypothetical protein
MSKRKHKLTVDKTDDFKKKELMVERVMFMKLIVRCVRFTVLSLTLGGQLESVYRVLFRHGINRNVRAFLEEVVVL